VIAVLLTLALSLLSANQLDTSQIPLESRIKYDGVKSIMVFVLNLSFFILIVLANIYSLSLKRVAIVPYLLVIAFYSGFVLADSYVITNYFELWQHSLRFFQGNLPDFHSHDKAWVKCGLGTTVILLNTGMIWWGLRK
jgi:hypothetical protein